MKFIVLLLSMTLSSGIFAQEQPTKSSFQSQNTTAFSKSIEQKNVKLIDVRTAAEFAEGHIPGAVNIDVNQSDFLEQVKKLKRSKILAVYCRSGRRSKIAATKLAEAGFLVVELANGLNEWTQAGMAVTK